MLNLSAPLGSFARSILARDEPTAAQAAEPAVNAKAFRHSFPLIDVLRAFAVISVVVYHVIVLFKWTDFPQEGVLAWFPFGWLGVDLFFVISGFVIGLSSFARFDRLSPAEFRSTYIRHRLARIVPLHYLTCLIFVALVVPTALFVPNFWEQVASHALFIHNWFPSHQGGINGVNWSLAVEMQFYVLVLVSIRWLRHARWQFILAVGIAVAWIWRTVAFFAVPPDPTLGTFPLFFAVTQLPGMLDEFALGILLARLVISPRWRPFLEQASRFVWLSGAVAVLAMWLTMKIFWSAEYWTTWYMVAFFRTLLAASYVSVLFVAITLRSRLIEIATAPLRYLGTISYGLYLWHLAVLLSLQRVTWLTGERALPYALALTAIIAMVSWHFFEKPILRRWTSMAQPPR